MLNLQKSCLECQKCNICNQIINKVPGQGNLDAKIMLIGEAPGSREDKLGKPFVGAAGTLLNSLLEEINLNKEEVYITNILKCRPPKNRNPRKKEIENCIGFLEKEIEIVNPKIIMTLGSVASKVLIRPNFLITQERGEVYKIQNRIILPTFHPAAILRDPTKEALIKADFKKLFSVIE